MSGHSQNAGAWPFAVGVPLVHMWCRGGYPLVQAFDRLVQGGSGLGSLRGGQGVRKFGITAPSALGVCAEMCSNDNALVSGGCRGGLRLVSIASNGRVLRNRPCLVPHGSPGGSLRAGGDFAALRAAQPRQAEVCP